jgi:putative protease
MELLSPAGSFEALRAAVQNGADAVYLAGNSFGARRSAKNFDHEELECAVAYSHLRGVRVYVTVNTLIHDAEIESALFFLHFLYEIGVDAVIVQDPALGIYILEHLPGMHVHASTQMAIHDVNGARLLEELGFHRVVLARELSKDQILTIRKGCKIELEVFGHGALCESCSGQCLMSSFLGGRSGNRGACAQPCRLPYELYDDERKVAGGYLLSPKDLSLVDKLCEINAGLFDSLKIEGRLKAPQYVGAVTRVYRKYIDHPARLSSEDREILLAAFNRSGFTDGYFTGKLGREMMSYETPANQANETAMLPHIRQFFKEIEKSWGEEVNLRKVPVSVHAVLKAGAPFQIVLTDSEGRSGVSQGTLLPEKAQKVAINLERLQSQACRLGGSVFEAKHFTCELEDELSLPVSEINAVRRDAAEKLEAERKKISLERREARPPVCSISSFASQKERIGRLTVSIETKEQLLAACEYDFSRLYVPQRLYEEAKALNLRTEIILKCPDILSGQIPMVESMLVGNLGYFYSQTEDQRLYGDYRLNVFNQMSANFYRRLGAKSLTLSLELTKREMEQISQNSDLPLECVVYGRAPMMLLRNCPFRSCIGSCPKDCSKMYLKDRMGERFYKICNRKVCTLLNAKPVYLADVFEKTIPKLDYYRLDFTIETAEECKEIIEKYFRALEGEQSDNPFGVNQFTRGHFVKGVL